MIGISILKESKVIILSGLAVLAPVKAAIIVTLILVVVDFVLGVWAAVKRKESITSSGFRRSIIKLVIYMLLIILGFLIETYLTGDMAPISKIVSAFIGMTELKSLVENMNDISGQNLLKSLIESIGNFNKQ